LEKNKKNEAFTAVSKQKKEVVDAKEKQVKPTNAFDALYASDDEEEGVSQVSNTNNVDEFPVLGATKKDPIANANAYSYATALATEVKPKPVVMSTVPVPAFKKTWTSWADCESSDEEDDEPISVASYKPVVYDDNSA
jgi:hypothetical protein